jgi:hypothetical protein
MPYFKCSKCHHEWEGSINIHKEKCEWCGAPGKVLEEKTPLEKLIDSWYDKEKR